MEDNPISEFPEVGKENSPPVKAEGKTDEEESALDDEFIKVEKESLEMRDSQQTAEEAFAKDDKPSAAEQGSSNSSRELLEAQEKARELEIEIQRLTGKLKHLESENSQQKDDVSHARQRLEQSEKKYAELEFSNKKLQEQNTEAEERHASQLHALQVALQAKEAENKDLIELKVAFDGLRVEHEHSRSRMRELELELKSSMEEARKFEGLQRKSGSDAEMEAKRAFELEKLLESEKMNAKEMQKKISFLEEEVKGLHNKIAEIAKVDEVLKTTTAELSAAQEELAASKSQVLDMEQRIFSKETLINELNQELDMTKASESEIRGGISALENLFASTKEELQAKVSEFEGMKLKLQEEMKAKELVETALRTREERISAFQQELAKLLKENEELEVTTVDLNTSAKQLKVLCGDLEEKLKLADENFRKTDSLLSQALSSNAELEQKLKSLEELHSESRAAAETSTQRNLELEDIIRASSSAAEDAKSQLRELETRFAMAEQKNVELQEQLNLVEQKSSDAETELQQSFQKITELGSTLSEMEEENKRLNDRKQEYQERVNQLESALAESSLQRSELEKELQATAEKCAQHEDQANTHRRRAFELQDLFHVSHSKAEGAGKRVRELELLLEADKRKIQDLEEQLFTSEKLRRDAEADCKKYFDKASEISSELKVFGAKAADLEAALLASNGKEKELKEALHKATEEKKNLEDSFNMSAKRLAELENTSEDLKNKLSLTQGNLELVSSDLEAAKAREIEIMAKLEHAEEQLQHQEKIVEEKTARHSELELLHRSLKEELEIRLQEAAANFSNKDSEAKSLFEKVGILEGQVKNYGYQLAEEVGKSAALKEELEKSFTKLAAFQSTNEELKQQILEVGKRAVQSSSENEMLKDTNTQLKSRIEELHELLNSVLSEKDATAQQLASHKGTIEDLTEKYSRAFELKSAAEARSVEAENQLKEAIEKLNQKESDARDLNEKLQSLADQLKLHEAQAMEASANAEVHKSQQEKTLLNLKNLEGILSELQEKAGHFEQENARLAQDNLKLIEEVASCESKLSDLQESYSATKLEKDETVEHLNISKKTIDDLMQQLTSEGGRLQSQISAVMEENNHLNETYQSAMKELETVIKQLEEEMIEHKEDKEALTSEIENLKAGIAEKHVLETYVHELEEKIVQSEAQAKEEVQNAMAAAARREAELISKLEDQAHMVRDREAINEQLQQLRKELQEAQSTSAEQAKAKSQKESELEATLKHSCEELAAKNNEIVLLGKQVKDLEEKLRAADAKTIEKGDGGSQAEPQDFLEVRSRDIGTTISTTRRRKHKKKLEVAPSPAPSASDIHAEAAEVSPITSFRFILGVVLISIIIGIILGKRY